MKVKKSVNFRWVFDRVHMGTSLFILGEKRIKKDSVAQ